MTRVQCIAGIKGHTGVIRGQAEGNCPLMPKTTKCGECCFRLATENINKLARNIIAYIVIVLLMYIGAVVTKLFDKIYACNLAYI